ncbi:MAG: hypothetical protein ACLPVF_07970 [Acidimicrobiales bacterium]
MGYSTSRRSGLFRAAGTVAVLTVGLVVAQAAAAGAAGSVSANPVGRTSELQSVSCGGGGSCVAVGQVASLRTTAGGSALLTGSKIGNAFPENGTDDLDSVACTSVACVGVGHNASNVAVVVAANQPDTVETDVPTSDVLSGVACADATTCYAVGPQNTGTDDDVVTITLSETAGVPAATVSNVASVASAGGTMIGISCGGGNCVAISEDGTYDVNGGNAPGTLPQQGQEVKDFTAIDCVTASLCFATGSLGSDFQDQGFIVPIDDDAVGPLADGPVGYLLNGLDCPSAAECLVVGNAGNPFDPDLNGGVLLSVSTQGTDTFSDPVSVAGSYYLESVSCDQEANCWLVGTGSGGGAAAYVGSDSFPLGVPLPDNSSQDPPHSYGAVGVGCLAGTKAQCELAGTQETSALEDRGAVEAVSGNPIVLGATRLIPSTTPGGGSNVLNAVTCVSTSTCYAVGEDSSGEGIVETITNGAPSQNPALYAVLGDPPALPPPPPETITATPGPMDLNAISCSTDGCLVVGSYSVGYGETDGNVDNVSYGVSLVFAGDGVGQEFPTAAIATSDATGYGGVDCQAASCIAVGTTDTISPPPQDQLDPGGEAVVTDISLANGGAGLGPVYGTSTDLPGDVPGISSVSLTGIDCWSTTACVAVGQDVLEAQGVEIGIVSGAPVGSLDYPSGVADLSGVSCTNLAAGVCLAVGNLSSGDGATLTITSGTAAAATDLIAMGTGFLNGVSCRTASECLAVGAEGSGASAVPVVVTLDPS